MVQPPTRSVLVSVGANDVGGVIAADRATAAQGAAHPVGGVDWPLELSPQQTSVWFVRMAQVWNAPALSALNVPEGGEASP